MLSVVIAQATLDLALHRDFTYKFNFEVSGFWSRHSASKRNVYIQWIVSRANKKKYH